MTRPNTEKATPENLRAIKPKCKVVLAVVVAAVEVIAVDFLRTEAM